MSSTLNGRDRGPSRSNRELNARDQFSPEIYQKIEMQNLIIFAIYSITQSGETCTYERLVAESFHMFPMVFRFRRYPQWPDSLKFDRPLRTLREKGFLVGTVKDHFGLTDFGRAKAKEIESVLAGKKTSIFLKKDRSHGRSVDDKLIEYLKDSEYFNRFLRDPKDFVISDPEFRRILRCTMETPERVLKQNLEYYKNVARSYNEKQILQFLTACESQIFKGGA